MLRGKRSFLLLLAARSPAHLALSAEIQSPYERAAAATAKSPHVDSKNQLVLIDTQVRFVQAAFEEQKFPKPNVPQVIAWKKKYSDGEINSPVDGFRTVFSHTNHAYWNPTRQIRSPEIPDSWLAPVNFYDGKIHYRVEVFEKLDNETVTALLSRVTTGEFEGTYNVWFGHGVVVFRDYGVHHFEQSVIARRPVIRDTKFDFDEPLFAMQLAVADLRGKIFHRRIEHSESTKFEGGPTFRSTSH